MEKVKKLASENGVMVFSKSSCCLCYAVSILLREVGANAYVHELDHDSEGKEMEKALIKMGCNPSVPALFIGGKLIGGTNEIMSLHLKGSLLQLLNPYISSDHL
ncbi:Glutaredoxin-C13 [Capsicum baccatum]|uniref:Glutaredoxin-C13 n=2 Tax=Capsicum TaxID=4071 RepID=A0A2G2ZEU7_CAPAN|nr:Glutaredoxin-C13 [Capsicum annuum]KAF3663404.1 Glutaredoxin-C13 [Capsicum annuum]PHT46530.1 Glutaredoxin-C13 [Capsicum baccatum]PHT80533.1 Glutaredoxin-C13 [Capsicum annuum]PHU16486.1 Glutaredoxin-C13 [Capsicum chinense]